MRFAGERSVAERVPAGLWVVSELGATYDQEVAVERVLGLGSVAGEGLLGEAVQAWPRWREDFRGLDQVGEPRRLREWLRTASREDARDVLVALATLGARDGRDEPAAAAMVAWALIPGAVALARRLGPRLGDRVPAALWIAIREVPWRTHRNVAASVLFATRRAVLAEEVGERHVQLLATADLAEIAESVLLGNGPAVQERPPAQEVLDLLGSAHERDLISAADREMLLCLIEVAQTAPMARLGHRQGLVSRQVCMVVGGRMNADGASVRRRVGKCIDRLATAARLEPVAR